MKTQPEYHLCIFVCFLMRLQGTFNVATNHISGRHAEKAWLNPKAGAPLTDFKRIGGSAVGGSSDEICSDYFPPIVSIPLPDRQTKSYSGNRKLPPIVGPKSDMADYR